MKHRVAELEGALLDAAVATCELIDRYGQWETDGITVRAYFCERDDRVGPRFPIVPFSPSADWQHGGPIIDRERIEFAVSNRESGWWANRATDEAGFHAGAWGPTHLIAAMRAFVASKLGEEVELP